MIKYIILAASLVLFSACSFFSTPKNEWQIKSVNAYESYQNYFLTDEQNLADADIKRAINYAKQSADLETLARIELARCALHIGVLEDDSCQEYLKLEQVAVSDEMHSYYLFLQNKLGPDEIKNLPPKYRAFATYKLKSDYDNANKEIDKMDTIVSKMISASLIKEHLDVDTVRAIIDDTSYYGYKKAAINWMKFYSTILENTKEKDVVHKKLKILND